MAGLIANKTKMFYKSEGASDFAELEYLMEVPEMGGTPEKIDVTVLSDDVKKFIHGIKDMGEPAFKFLYDNTNADSNYRILKGLDEEIVDFKIVYPDETGHKFKAIPTVKMDAGTINGVLTFTCSMTMQSDITPVEND